MFKYVYPQFEKKRLLRGEMLDQLRDYPKNYIKMSFQGYGDGVLAGCKLTWDNARLTVLPGIILYKGSLYIMETPYEMDCTALDRMRYLKYSFWRKNEKMEVSWEILGYHWTMKNQIRHAKLSYADSAFRRELSSGTNTKGLKTIQPYMIR